MPIVTAGDVSLPGMAGRAAGKGGVVKVTVPDETLDAESVAVTVILNVDAARIPRTSMLCDVAGEVSGPIANVLLAPPSLVLVTRILLVAGTLVVKVMVALSTQFGLA